MDELTWIVEYGERLSIVAILIIIIMALAVGLYRRWWVPGWMYQDCTDKLQKLEKEMDREVERTRVRLETLESVKQADRANWNGGR